MHYGDVPLWVLFKTTSLGTLNRFFDCCDPTVQKRVTDIFPHLRRETLARMLDVMNKFRNVCAHNDCLYAYRAPTGIPPMPILRNFSIPAFAEESIENYEGNDLFAMLVIFSYLLSDADFEKCLTSLKSILDHFFSVCKALPPSALYRCMGFPLDGNLTLADFR
jgi:abortive infection bacteriophage resistance protein